MGDGNRVDLKPYLKWINSFTNDGDFLADEEESLGAFVRKEMRGKPSTAVEAVEKQVMALAHKQVAYVQDVAKSILCDTFLERDLKDVGLQRPDSCPNGISGSPPVSREQIRLLMENRYRYWALSAIRQGTTRTGGDNASIDAYAIADNVFSKWHQVSQTDCARVLSRVLVQFTPNDKTPADTGKIWLAIKNRILERFATSLSAPRGSTAVSGLADRIASLASYKDKLQFPDSGILLAHFVRTLTPRDCEALEKDAALLGKLITPYDIGLFKAVLKSQCPRVQMNRQHLSEPSATILAFCECVNRNQTPGLLLKALHAGDSSNPIATALSATENSRVCP